MCLIIWTLMATIKTPPHKFPWFYKRKNKNSFWVPGKNYKQFVRASLTQCTWVWANSGSWWWRGRPGMLQSMGSQRVGHDWATELNWIHKGEKLHISSYFSTTPLYARSKWRNVFDKQEKKWTHNFVAWETFHLSPANTPRNIMSPSSFWEIYQRANNRRQKTPERLRRRFAMLASASARSRAPRRLIGVCTHSTTLLTDSLGWRQCYWQRRVVVFNGDKSASAGEML